MGNQALVYEFLEHKLFYYELVTFLHISQERPKLQVQYEVVTSLINSSPQLFNSY